MNNKNKKGFTLIELLIVIGIIAILAAAVIIAINPGRQFEQARNATRWSHMNSIVNAVYSYAIDNQGTFPSCVSAGAESVTNCESDLVSDYMSSIPEDPQGGSGTDNYQIELLDKRVKIYPSSGVSDTTTDLEIIQ